MSATIEPWGDEQQRRQQEAIARGEARVHEARIKALQRLAQSGVIGGAHDGARSEPEPTADGPAGY